jgi:drug/metabolite transporter (DMT)-like permease
MSTLSAASAAEPRTSRRARALAVLGAALAALLVWAVASVLVSHLRQPAFGGGQPQDLSAGVVAVAAVIGGLLAWAALALIERLSTNPRRVWSVAAPLALLVSLGGPLSGAGISGANRVALVLMHIAVAAVVIPSFYRSSPARNAAGGGRA